jgi:Sulfatase
VTPAETLKRRALHIFVLTSLAAAPILLVTDAQFFIGRGASRSDVVAVALILVVGAPAVLALFGLLVSAVSDRLGWALHLALIGALSALILSEALYPLSLRLEIQAPLVIVAGVAAAIAYARQEGARSLVSALAPLPVIILVFVFLLTPLSGLVFSGGDEVEASPQADARTPVVMVVFDELPGHALMNAKGQIDAERFPTFASLAEDATWYRNATTSRSDTELAVPTLATGINAPLDSLATYNDHPRSLFTLLGSSYEMHVSEPWTNLCPDRLCEGGTESLDEGGLGSILATIPSILGYVSVPDAKRLGISSPRESGAITRPGQFETFVDEIEPTSGPVLHYLHVLLPHKSWKYLPSGEQYSDTVGADAELGGLEEWEGDEWDVLQHEQRFLLQLEYTDRLLGELLSKLRDAGLYERSLIVVAADHGVSFRSGDQRRDATETNAPDILSVPLIIKEPRQREGKVDNGPARTIDVMPTIADAIGAEIPWEVDGMSLFDSLPPDRPLEIENLRGGELELTLAEFAKSRDEALERRIDALGDGEDSLYAIGPSAELHGRPVHVNLGQEAAAEASIVDGVAVRNFDPTLPLTPARIAGDLEGIDAGEPMAVALNGRVAATTYSYEGDHGVEFSAMVPPKLIQPGDNELAVLAIDGTGDDLTLRPLRLSF